MALAGVRRGRDVLVSLILGEMERGEKQERTSVMFLTMEKQ